MSTDTTEEQVEDPKRRKESFGRLFVGYLTEANSVMVTIYSLLLAFAVGAVLIVVSDEAVRPTWSYFFARPGDALNASWRAVADAYASMFEGAIVNTAVLSGYFADDATLAQVFRPLSNTLTNATPLIFTGLAVGLAFKAGLFNIGAQGQMLIGMLGALIVGFTFDLPAILHIPLAIAAAFAAGALYGAVPGFLKAKTGAHEVISSIMLNNIAGLFLVWTLSTTFIHSETRPEQISKPVADSAQLPLLLGFLGRGLNVSLALILGLATAVVVWWLLNRSTFGFRIRAVGFNEHASATAGMNIGRTYTTVMGSAGGLAGLAGAALVLGVGSGGITENTALEYGFDGITVALLGRANPYGIVGAALLFGALKAGALSSQSYVSVDISTVLQAVIVLFIAAPALVKAVLRLRTPRGGLVTLEAKGW